MMFCFLESEYDDEEMWEKEDISDDENVIDHQDQKFLIIVRALNVADQVLWSYG